MVELDIADYLTMQLGEDVYAHELPANINYGVYVRLLDEEYEDGRLIESIIGCFVTDGDYNTCRGKIEKVKDAVLSFKGLDGWTSGGRVRVSNLGTNAAGDEMMVVTATIYSEGE